MLGPTIDTTTGTQDEGDTHEEIGRSLCGETGYNESDRGQKDSYIGEYT